MPRDFSSSRVVLAQPTKNKLPLLEKMQDGWDGGIDAKNPPTRIRDDRGAGGLGADLSSPGVIKKRQGTGSSVVDVGSKKIRDMAFFTPSNGTKRLIIAESTKVHEWTGSGASSEVITGLTDDIRTRLAQGTDLMMVINGTDNVRTFDNALSVTDEGDTNTSPPKGKVIQFMRSQNRMIIANTTLNPDFLFYSDSEDIQSWNRSNNNLEIGQDGEPITGIFLFTDDDLIVFKADLIIAVDVGDADPTKWTQRIISEGIGCIADRTIRQFGADLLFLSRDGVRTLLQSEQDKKRGASDPLSLPIQPTVDRIRFTSAIDSMAFIWQDTYHCAVPIDSNTVNSGLISFRRPSKILATPGGWTVDEKLDLNAAVITSFDDLPEIHVGSALADGKVFELFTDNDDDGAAYDFRWDTKRFDFDSPGLDKWFQEVEFIFNATDDHTVECFAQIDGGGFTSLGTVDLKGNAPTLPIALPFQLGGTVLVRKRFGLRDLGWGRDIQYRVENNNVNEDVEWRQVISHALPIPQRRNA